MITAALLLVLLVFALLASGTGWSNVLSPARNELVFADRNRAYGAYTIRREHHRTMLMSILFGLGLVSAALFVPKLFASSVTPPAHRIVTIVMGDDIPTLDDREKKPEKTTVVATKTDRHPNDMSRTVIVDSVKTLEKGTVTGRTVDRGDQDSTATSGSGSTGGTGGGGGGDGTGSKVDTTASSPVLPDEMPEYPGGERSLYTYLERSIRYPHEAVETGTEGLVRVVFLVTEDGTVTDVRIQRSVSPEIDAEAIRVVRSMKKWKPGRYKGKAMTSPYSIPIRFTLH